MTKREFRSRGPEKKPHSRAPEPRKGKPSGVRILKARGGTTKGKEGGPKIGRPKNPRDKWRDRIKNMGKRRSLTDILSGGVKGKPHSSKEGRKAAARRTFSRIAARGGPMPKLPKPKRIPGEQRPIDPRSPYVKDRVMTPLRAKHGIGGVIKKGISQLLKPKGVFKPKPVPKAVTDVDKPFKGYDKSYTKADDKKMDAILKNLGDEIKAQPLPPKLKETMKKLKKAYPQGIHARNKESKKVFKSAKGKAAGGRISRGHGGSTMQQHYLQHGFGPTKAKLRAGKPKIAKKGWA